MKRRVGKTADPQKVAIQRKAQKHREQLDADAMNAVLSTDEGRRVLWNILSACNLEGPSHGAASLDAQYMAFREGERNVGRRLLAMIDTADPQAYPSMLSQAAQERNRERLAANDEQEQDDE